MQNRAGKRDLVYYDINEMMIDYNGLIYNDIKQLQDRTYKRHSIKKIK